MVNKPLTNWDDPPSNPFLRTYLIYLDSVGDYFEVPLPTPNKNIQKHLPENIRPNWCWRGCSPRLGNPLIFPFVWGVVALF